MKENSQVASDVLVIRMKKANKQKLKVKVICKQMDDVKAGYLDPQVFSQVLKLNKIKLPKEDFETVMTHTEVVVNG